MVPFLKWPGGKRWFIARHANLLPTTFVRYFEPFLGGGSVFFHLKPEQAILSDFNKELIDVYKFVRDNRRKHLEKSLQNHQERHDERYYYQVRETIPDDPIERVSRTLYLNRTCFNGMYRVNLDGRFNVPKGTKTAVVLDTDDFAAAAKLLRHADLRVSDFEPIIDMAQDGDFVFADPPLYFWS